MAVAMLGWFVAGVCAVGFIALWLYISFRDLSLKRKSFTAIRKQILFHSELQKQALGGKNEAVAADMLRVNHKLYEKAEKEYIDMLKKPLYSIPGLLMGFRTWKHELKI